MDFSRHRPASVLQLRRTKFSGDSEATLKDAGIQCNRRPGYTPNLNTKVELFDPTIRPESLHHLSAFGQRNHECIFCKVVTHYN